MVEIPINLVPFGDRDRTKQIGKITIINDGTGNSVKGNYRIVVESLDVVVNGAGSVKKFKIEGFERDKGIMSLLELVVQKYNKQKRVKKKNDSRC